MGKEEIGKHEERKPHTWSGELIGKEAGDKGVV